MKKNNRRGFTLIELLAVITIMGILMLVAIPAVSRTIENSRRDTFANITKTYIDAIRNGFIADNISCQTTVGSDDYKVASGLPSSKTYYFPIATLANEDYTAFGSDFEQSTKDLMESGGKSPFGNSEMYGYVSIKRATKKVGDNEVIDTTYKIALVDTGNHGLKSPVAEDKVKRAAVNLNATNAVQTVGNALNGKLLCKYV